MDDGALTRRQEECLRLVADGLPNRHIAATLGLSIDTVSNHLTAAYKNLGIAGGPLLSARIAAVRWFVEQEQRGADDGRSEA
jgi:DNA-binding NarL/FixJ family response regulator